MHDPTFRWDTTIGAIEDCVLLLDQDFKIIAANKSQRDFFKKTDDEIIGRHCWELVHGTTEPPDFCPMASMLKSKKREASTTELAGIWVRVTVDPIFDEDGALKGAVHIIRNIDELERQNIVIKESEKKYSELVKTMSDVVFTLDFDGGVVDTSPTMKNIIGWSREELVGKHFSDFVHPDDIRIAEEEYLRAIQGIGRPIEIRVISLDGTVRWVRINALLIMKDGEPENLLCVLSDVHEKKIAEDALRESEGRYRMLVENAAEAILVAQDGLIRLVNPMVVTITGFSEQELLSKPFPLLIHPDDRALVVERHQRRLRGEPAPSGYDFRVVAKDGSTKWVHVRAVAVEWKGRPATLNLLSDITERKLSEDAMQRSQKKYRQLVELAQEGIWAIDTDSITTYANPKLAEILGYTSEEMMGRHLFSFMDEHGREIAQIELDRRKQGIKEQHDFEFLRKDGQRILASLETSPITDDAGDYIGALAVVADVTTRRAASEALVKRTEETENAKVKARAYFDFLAHDMANLLSPVLAYAELISLDAKTPEPSKIKARKIADQARRASSFILSLRRLEDLELTTQERMESRDLGTIMDEAVTRVKAEYEDKHISATVVHTDEPVKFMGGKHLESIIIGILENSVAVADRDEIALEVKATLVRENGHKFLMLELTDDGPGITDDLKGCFLASVDPTKQFETGMSRGVASTLLVSSAIVNNLGGELRIEDRIPGDCSKGSRIVIKFPQEGFFGA